MFGQLEGDAEIKRNVAYFFGLIAEDMIYHDELMSALDETIALASLEDQECQEMSAFTLAHLSSNRDHQETIVQRGALKPLVSMVTTSAEASNYSALAILKLSENFAVHMQLASSGAIQALLAVARQKSTDEELQYRASLSVAQLASNAVSLLPTDMMSSGLPSPTRTVGGLSRRSAKDRTKQFLEKSVKKTK